MKTSRLCLSTLTAVALAIGLFTAPPAAHADTYQIFDLGSETIGLNAVIDRGFVGLTDSGTVVLTYGSHAPGPCNLSQLCYETWVNGVMVNFSTTAPNFTYDNGTPCGLPDTSFSTFLVGGAICNNGREVYWANSETLLQGIFTGPDLADFVAYAAPLGDVFALNSSGDFVYDVHHPTEIGGEIYEAIDLTTDQVPEPGSIFLLGTGLLAAVGTMRRCLSQYKET